jgi:hypothetical protein
VALVNVKTDDRARATTVTFAHIATIKKLAEKLPGLMLFNVFGAVEPPPKAVTVLHATLATTTSGSCTAKRLSDFAQI